jgi:hypothetical protein
LYETDIEVAEKLKKITYNITDTHKMDLEFTYQKEKGEKGYRDWWRKRSWWNKQERVYLVAAVEVVVVYSLRVWGIRA